MKRKKIRRNKKLNEIYKKLGLKEEKKEERGEREKKKSQRREKVSKQRKKDERRGDRSTSMKTDLT